MDTAKLRLLAAALGVVFGLIGLAALAVAITIALSSLIGIVWATTATGALLLALSCVCIVIFLEPQKSTSKEIESVEDATADVLADLPFNALSSIVEKRPMTVAAAALLTGYTLMRPDANTSKSLHRILLNLL